MNNARRKAIAALQARLEEALNALDGVVSDVAALQQEEQDAFDNLSEGLQQSERGQQSEAAAEALEEAAQAVDAALERLQEAIDTLTTAAE